VDKTQYISYNVIQGNNMTQFSSLKKSSKTSLERLTQEINKLSNTEGGGGADDRFWKPDVDKSGNGYAVIRFLPAPGEEDVPFVRIWDHGFQGSGGWYIEKSLTTLGQKDPVSEYNSELWNSGVEANKDQVRKQKRRLSFISNVYIVKDPSHPENEGKVFLYQYGKKIFDKLNAAMNPEFQDEDPINPFDLWTGANFKLKIRNVEGYRNYDSSAFDKSEPLFDDDERLESIWKSEHSLQEFIDPSNFKSYEELKTKLHRVLGLSGGAPKPRTTAETPWDDDTPAEQAPRAQKAFTPKPAAAKPAPVMDGGGDEDDDMAFFRRLAEE
jgi:hypothetical protein